MKISELITALEALRQEHGDLETVSGDYEEVVRRGRVKNNVSPVDIELIASPEKGEDMMVLFSDGCC